MGRRGGRTGGKGKEGKKEREGNVKNAWE